MKQCWSEGELRAYFDCELPPRDMERVAAHLETCAACGHLYAQLRARAERLNSWMQALPEPEPLTCLPAVPQRTFSVRWAAIAAGIAAAAVLGVAFWPNGNPKIAIAPAPVTRTTPPVPAPPPVKPAIVRPVPRPVLAKPKPQIQYYFALDDEPIETGLVVRVGLNGGQVPADVIVGPDGRARAFRLVSDTSGELK